MKPRIPETPADEAGTPVAPESPRDGAEATDLPPVDDVETRLAAAVAERDRALDAQLRAHAELQNARRRAARELDEAERRGAERTLAPVLAVADDLDRALEAAAQTGEKDGALAQGVQLVLTRLLESLAAEGVTPIVPHAEPFDPRHHEALVSAPHPTLPAGHVTQVIARGWAKGDRLLRAAKVLVSSGPPTTGAGED